MLKSIYNACESFYLNVKQNKLLLLLSYSSKQTKCVCNRISAITSWEIGQASAEDEGLYECVAQSNAGQGRALTQLTIRGMPHTH